MEPDVRHDTDEHDRLFRPAYHLGYEAAADPRFEGRGFDQIEKDLENGWLSVRSQGDWQSVRDYCREGFERGRAIGIAKTTEDIGSTPSHQRPSFSDPVARDEI